jgi:hypothetical protein
MLQTPHKIIFSRQISTKKAHEPLLENSNGLEPLIDYHTIMVCQQNNCEL